LISFILTDSPFRALCCLRCSERMRRGHYDLRPTLGHYTHAMKKDVKKKSISPPLGKTRVW
jgi:hypothetical protein